LQGLSAVWGGGSLLWKERWDFDEFRDMHRMDFE